MVMARPVAQLVMWQVTRCHDRSATNCNQSWPVAWPYDQSSLTYKNIKRRSLKHQYQYSFNFLTEQCWRNAIQEMQGKGEEVTSWCRRSSCWKASEYTCRYPPGSSWRGQASRGCATPSGGQYATPRKLWLIMQPVVAICVLLCNQLWWSVFGCTIIVICDWLCDYLWLLLQLIYGIAVWPVVKAIIACDCKCRL